MLIRLTALEKLSPLVLCDAPWFISVLVPD